MFGVECGKLIFDVPGCEPSDCGPEGSEYEGSCDGTKEKARNAPSDTCRSANCGSDEAEGCGKEYSRHSQEFKAASAAFRSIAPS